MNALKLRGHPESAPRPYAANLVLVWEYVQQILPTLRGRLIVTGDHGELLGEHRGQRGHGDHWKYGKGSDYPELYRVPWYVVTKENFEPADIQGKQPETEIGRETLTARLEGLGYL